jgi:valyl-tRNA synthetase
MANFKVPEKPSLDGIEEKWVKQWDETGAFKFDENNLERENVYSIDTPPPTVSGSLHIGHVFSYTHTDIIARYQRMKGKNVFYPMGWDDNGLPTERRVQNFYGVKCDPTLPYTEDLKTPFNGDSTKKLTEKDYLPISRQNFIELCLELSTEDEKKFKELWQRAGLSVDWNYTYQTIDDNSRKISQQCFLENLKNNQAYSKEAPGLWDITFQTAVAQAELEAREYPGFYHTIIFTSGAEQLKIDTTRPELLAGCVALIVNPDDERYKHLVGKTAISPIYNVEVPIVADEKAEIDKGTGIVMNCTFGDLVDVEWWRKFQFDSRVIIDKFGRIKREDPEWITDASGLEAFQEIQGKTLFSAREILVEQLQGKGLMIGDPKPTQRMTNFYEKGEKPLEIVSSRQWYIRNGGTDQELNKQLLKRGDELNFYPKFMGVRYKNWVEGLNSDWLVSRQRYFGIAFPIWYKLDQNLEPDYDNPLVPNYDQLPIDPQTAVPNGFTEDQRNQPDGFTAENDVLDTWATSSLTPQIAVARIFSSSDGNNENSPSFGRGGTEGDGVVNTLGLFPMDLRPQGQDIIRTWLFSTVVRSNFLENSLPWKSAAISGFILDPDRKKMSKSKGNVVTPMDLLVEHSSDALRYWSALSKLGNDGVYNINDMKVGRRLCIKLLNVAKFALNLAEKEFSISDIGPSNTLDQAFISKLNDTVKYADEKLANYEHSLALNKIEMLFWQFCDEYVELVKTRAYEGDISAKATLFVVVDTFTKLLMPFIPFTCSEVRSWFTDEENSSVSYPEVNEVNAQHLNDDNSELTLAIEVTGAIRKIKADNNVSQRTPLQNLKLQCPKLDSVTKGDIKNLANAENIEFSESDEIKVLNYKLGDN